MPSIRNIVRLPREDPRNRRNAQAGKLPFSVLESDLDVNGFDIISTSNQDIELRPDGTGVVRVANTLVVQGSSPKIEFEDIAGAPNTDAVVEVNGGTYSISNPSGPTVFSVNLSTGTVQLVGNSLIWEGVNGRLGIQDNDPIGLFHLGGGNTGVAGTALMANLDCMFDSPWFSFGEYQNFLLQTEVFDNASWIKTGIGTVTANSATDPLGTALAENIPAGADASSRIAQTITNSTTGNWTFSVWLRAQSGTATINLRIDTSAETDPTPKSISLTTRWKRYAVSRNITLAHSTKTVVINSATNAISAWAAQLEPTATARPYSGPRTTTALTTLTRTALIPTAVSITGTMTASSTVAGVAGTFTGAVSCVTSCTIIRSNLVVTSNDGFVCANNTAATAGVPVQISPRLRLTGAAWNTTPTAANNAMNWKIENVPASGGPPTSRLTFGFDRANLGYATQMTLSSGGNLGLPNIQSGPTQPSGVGPGDLWKTAGHATLPDNVVLVGV
jgi:hypothetical protein